MRRSICLEGDIPGTKGSVALILFVFNSKGMKGFDQDDGRSAGGFTGGNESGNGEDAGGKSEVNQGASSRRHDCCKGERKSLYEPT